LSFKGFDLITTRHEVYAEIFSSVWLSYALTEMRGVYDYVLVDVASYPMISDALLIARHADTIVSVIRLGNTERRSGEEHVRGMSAVGRHHMILVNDAGVQVSYGLPGSGGRRLPPVTHFAPARARLPELADAADTLSDVDMR
jgi:Mrp family chromosome partitioning ATPase